jgi:DNA transformation protein
MTAEELFDIGAIEAYRRVKSVYPDRVSLNLLYALQGAFLDIPWNELPAEMKASLHKEAETKLE